MIDEWRPSSRYEIYMLLNLSFREETNGANARLVEEGKQVSSNQLQKIIRRSQMTEESTHMQSLLYDVLPKVKNKPSSSRSPRNQNKNGIRLDTVVIDLESEDDQSESAANQLVLYSPLPSNAGQDVLAVPYPSEKHSGSFRSFLASDSSSRVLPSVGAFTVQCAMCYKWRFIPSKEKYEEIRENIMREPFVCGRAREWRPDISCADPADINQDGSRLWAIDKPNIAQPPPGWERLLRIRGEGSTKFADIYYAAPSGKRLRSMVEIEKYLYEHPEYIRNGVNLSQFSFQIPRPLQEDYVRKRGAPRTNFLDGASSGLSRPLDPYEVNPLSWAAPPTRRELELGRPGLSAPYFEPPPAYHPPRREVQLGGLGLSTPYFELPPAYHPPPVAQQLAPAKKKTLAVKKPRTKKPRTHCPVHLQPHTVLNDSQQASNTSSF